MFTVVTIDTPELGDRSYLVHDGSLAVVIDPQRDIDRLLEAAEAAGVEVTHVAETHLHNDYVSGGLALARETGAEYLVGASEEVSFERRPVDDRTTIATGAINLSVLATPGHTPGHVAYLIASDGSTPAVFTGGSLLYGSVGRTDLSGEEKTLDLARAQLRSVRRLAELVGREALVMPTHGFGSFCASSTTGSDRITSVGDELRSNRLLDPDTDEETMVRGLLAGLVPFPRYYERMGAINAAGPRAIGTAELRRIGPDELAERLGAGEWIVDLRKRALFAADHATGTISFEHGNSFSTYLGWVVPWGVPLGLVSDDADQVDRARRDLARIGFDELSGAAIGPLGQLAPAAGRSSYEVSDFEGLAEALVDRPVVVLDVRRDDEWRAGHIRGAHHLFVADLTERIDEVPPGEVWVHCAAGYRSAIAASLLDRAGRKVVQVDDEWPNAGPAGLPIVGG